MKLRVVNHPLIKAKLTILQDVDTKRIEFRKALRILTTLMAFEATKGIRVKTVSIDTPIAKTEGVKINETIVLCPVLRSGMAMVDSFLDLIPDAIVAPIGVTRNDCETQMRHQVYYQPNHGDALSQTTVYVLEPMIATGLSLNLTLSYLKSVNARKIIVVSIIGAPQGINFLMEKHPDADIYLACLGDRLTKENFITPGLGDAGDRFFGIN